MNTWLDAEYLEIYIVTTYVKDRVFCKLFAVKLVQVYMSIVH